MKIGGWQKVTLLDYPGKVAATIFTAGCNLACRFCYNPQLVKPSLIKQTPLLTEKTVLDFLQRRRKYLDGVCLTGGEPTLQPDLLSFCQKLKKLGYAVKLDTNGLKPEVVQQLIKQNLVDYVAMDIKAPLAKYEKIVGVKVNLSKIKTSLEGLLAWQKKMGERVVVEFRSTVVPGLHTVKDVEQIAKLIKDAPLYVLQNFNQPSRLVDEKFKPAKGKFTTAEMHKFQTVAQKYVGGCELRLNF